VGHLGGIAAQIVFPVRRVAMLVGILALHDAGAGSSCIIYQCHVWILEADRNMLLDSTAREEHTTSVSSRYVSEIVMPLLKLGLGRYMYIRHVLDRIKTLGSERSTLRQEDAKTRKNKRGACIRHT